MSVNQRENFRLLSDEPILESRRKDHLQFEHAARVLAGAAMQTESPITIGIYGNWGSGKTSLMRLMKKIVDDEGIENAAIAVWFNAWQYEKEENLIVPLIATIARDIEKTKELWKKLQDSRSQKALQIIKDGGQKVHNALRSVLYGISMKGKLGVPLLGELEISASMKNMIERYEAVTKDTLMARSLYFDAFDQLRELSQDTKILKPQIIVFIDDLDRCFPEKAVKLLESVKLILHQPKFAFVLGIYPEIIEDFIRNKYAAEYPVAVASVSAGGGEELQNRLDRYLDYFNDYLGKIVQVRHDVPERNPGQMHDYIRDLLDDANVASEFFVEGVSEEELLNLIAEVGERRPREIVRKINWLIVKWRITRSERKDGKFDLLAGLINETIQDRVSKGKTEYKQFLRYLEWTAGEDESETYGKALSKSLSNFQKKEDHLDKINMIKKDLNTENSPTWKSIIEILEKDEQLCNILSSEPGCRWLSDKKYREEMQETYTEKEYREERPKAVIETKEPGDFENIIQGLRFVDVPGGEFMMGSDEGKDYEKPVHTVKPNSFKISAATVTQGQYEEVMGVNPSYFKGKGQQDKENLPVEYVSWNDAMVFCERLSKLAKGKYKVTLPTEAQWEYAARGGDKSEGYKYSGSNNLGKVGWYADNSEEKTHAVAAKKPNELGIYDMSGNVWEWCLDKWHNNYDGAPTDGSAWEKGDSSFRILRGGSWGDLAGHCRVAYHGGDHPEHRYSYVGFRLVLVP
ncbi:MAG: SUMF1/EgtB/PvdO family nonheme iron enzyme [Ignavibacteria bacterium]|jgi:formylglycine-generating enzyme required for sulfatase activity